MPCIIEANKTIDNKNLYKSSDISQMMFVHSEDFKLKSEEDIEMFDPFKAKGKIFIDKSSLKTQTLIKLYGKKTMTIGINANMDYLRISKILEEEGSKPKLSIILMKF